MTLTEDYYDSGNAPHEALGRAARRLASGGALYLGGGVGVEKQKTKSDGQGESYALTRSSGKAEAFSGPLSAVMRAFALAGASSDPNSPGGTAQVTEPAAAARLRELVDEIRRCEQDIARYQARADAKGAAPTVYAPGTASDESWEVRRVAELRRELAQLKSERDLLVKTGKVEEAADSLAKASTPEPFSKSKTSNWVARGGGLPAYIQHIAHDLMEKRGKSESNAIQMAIGIVKRWARGGGNVDATTRAAAAKAVAEWERLKAGAKAKGAGKAAVKESALREARALADIIEGAAAEVALIESALGAGASFELAEREDSYGSFVRARLDVLAEFGDPTVLLWQELREEFSERLHPRDPHGQFMEKIGGLKKQGDKASLFGVQVSHSGGRGYRVSDLRGDMGKMSSAFTSNPKSAAEMAVGRSLHSTNPESLGGAKRYTSLADLPGGGREKPSVLRLPGSRGANRAGRERTPKEQQRFNAATRSAQRAAQDRHREIEAKRVSKLAAETQKGIAGQVDSLVAQGLSRQRALKQVAEHRSMTVSAVEELHTKHGRERPGRTAEAEADGRGGVGMLVEAFSSGVTAGSDNPAVRDARRRGGAKTPGTPRTPAGSYDDAKHPRGARGTSAGGKFVRSGSSGTDVRTVQHKLGVSTDGKYGPKTQEAVKAYQRKHGLTVDGVVGRQTVAALAGKSNASSIKPGALSSADRGELRRIRRSQVRRRAAAPQRSGGGMVI